MASRKSKNNDSKSQSTNGLLSLSAMSLLNKFGEGLPIPGAGSAAALSGLLGGKLAITVIKLTIAKPKYKSSHAELTLIKEDIEKNIEPRLFELIDKDSEVFSRVIQARKKRDAEESAFLYDKYNKEALELQKQATLIPFELSELCISLAKHSRRIYDTGFKSARGDSGAAFSNAIAGATAALFVTLLNLRDFKNRKWAQDLIRKCDDNYKLILELQVDLFKRIRNLKTEEQIPSFPKPTNVFHLLESIADPRLLSGDTSRKLPKKGEKGV